MDSTTAKSNERPVMQHKFAAAVVQKLRLRFSGSETKDWTKTYADSNEANQLYAGAGFTGTVATPSARLRLGKLVVASPTCLEFGLRFHHRLEPATARDAAVLSITADKYKRALNSHRATSRGDLTLERAEITALVSVLVVEVAALRAFSVERVGYTPVGNIRVVPQRIGRSLCAVNFGDAHLVVRLVGKWECGLFRDFSRERSCNGRHIYSFLLVGCR